MTRMAPQWIYTRTHAACDLHLSREACKDECPCKRPASGGERMPRELPTSLHEEGIDGASAPRNARLKRGRPQRSLSQHGPHATATERREVTVAALTIYIYIYIYMAVEQETPQSRKAGAQSNRKSSRRKTFLTRFATLAVSSEFWNLSISEMWLCFKKS